jgi:hypothetical protein
MDVAALTAPALRVAAGEHGLRIALAVRTLSSLLDGAAASARLDAELARALRAAAPAQRAVLILPLGAGPLRLELAGRQFSVPAELRDALLAALDHLTAKPAGAKPSPAAAPPAHSPPALGTYPALHAPALSVRADDARTPSPAARGETASAQAPAAAAAAERRDGGAEGGALRFEVQQQAEFAPPGAPRRRAEVRIGREYSRWAGGEAGAVSAARLRLELPSLGAVAIDLRLAGAAIALHADAAAPAGARLRDGLPALAEALAARGLQPVALTVESA